MSKEVHFVSEEESLDDEEKSRWRRRDSPLCVSKFNAISRLQRPVPRGTS